MPFNDTATLILAEARTFLGSQPAALELFDQTLDVTDDLLDYLAQESTRYGISSPFAELRGLAPAERRPHVPLLYKALGFSSWEAIDSYPGRGNLVMDLNENLRARYGFDRRFDLVSNKGSTEHVFDQRAVFENIHEACRPGGLMVHDVPTMNVFNHAFYGYHPGFFAELAAANGYEILDLRLANRWGDTVRVRISPDAPPPPVGYRPRPTEATPVLPPFLEMEDFLRKTVPGASGSPLAAVYEALSQRGALRRPGNPGEVFIAAILRKTEDGPFRVPFQKKFLSYLQADEFRERYARQLAPPP